VGRWGKLTLFIAAHGDHECRRFYCGRTKLGATAEGGSCEKKEPKKGGEESVTERV